MTQKTCYEILGVSRDAHYGEIKKAYRRLAKELHPDKTPNASEEDRLRFAEIAEAYAILSNLDRRKHYDQTLEGSGPRGAGPFWQPHYSGYPYFRYDVFTPFIHGVFMGGASPKKSPQILYLSILFNWRVILVSIFGALMFFKFFTAFEGKVTGKSVGEGLLRINSRYIEVDKGSGESSRQRVRSELYDQVKEGDRIVKRKFSFAYSINGKEWNQVGPGNFLARVGLIYVFVCGGLLFLECSRK